MAVRRQLLLLFRDQQAGGAITVERTGLGTGETQRPPLTIKTPENAEKCVPRCRGLRLEDLVVYQCRNCRAVLGDSLHLCAREGILHLLVFFKVTNEVLVQDNLMVCVEGDLIGCTYNVLKCQSCGTAIGFKLYCSKSLAYLRGFFCLFTDSMICYLLKTKATVEASKVKCPTVSLKDEVQKLKENLVVVHKRIELLIKKLEELNHQTTLVENQGYKRRSFSQVDGCTRKKSKQLTGCEEYERLK